MVPASSVPCICHFYFHWRAKCAKDSQAHPLPYGLLSSSLPCSARFLHDKPFFSSTGVLMNFTVVLSSISVVSSTRSCSIKARRICSHTPAFVNARNLLHTLCHGPNRSGKSRQGTPVLSQYRIALSISLLLFPGRPPCGFLYFGNKSLILFHCFSLISCRFILLILSFRLFAHNSWVLKQTLGASPVLNYLPQGTSFCFY